MASDLTQNLHVLPNVECTEAEGGCGVCAHCRRRASLMVGSLVIESQIRRRNTAVGSRQAEQRRYVKNLTIGVLEMLELVPPRSGPEEFRIQEWGRAMRVRQK
jgi:hypothetical protein